MKQLERYKIFLDLINIKILDALNSHFVKESLTPMMVPTLFIGIPVGMAICAISTLGYGSLFLATVVLVSTVISILVEYA